MYLFSHEKKKKKSVNYFKAQYLINNQSLN